LNIKTFLLAVAIASFIGFGLATTGGYYMDYKAFQEDYQ